MKSYFGHGKPTGELLAGPICTSWTDPIALSRMKIGGTLNRQQIQEPPTGIAQTTQLHRDAQVIGRATMPPDELDVIRGEGVMMVDFVVGQVRGNRGKPEALFISQ